MEILIVAAVKVWIKHILLDYPTIFLKQDEFTLFNERKIIFYAHENEKSFYNSKCLYNKNYSYPRVDVIPYIFGDKSYLWSYI